MNSRAKGKRGELEAVRVWRSYGYQEVRRGVQYNGADGSADIIGIPGIHCEVKRVEHLDLAKALRQSMLDSWAAGKGELPIVMHRRNNCPWFVTMDSGVWNEIKDPDIETQETEKETKRYNLEDLMAEAYRKADGTDVIPVVKHRKPDSDLWLVTMFMGDFITIYREWEAGINDQ